MALKKFWGVKFFFALKSPEMKGNVILSKKSPQNGQNSRPAWNFSKSWPWLSGLAITAFKNWAMFKNVQKC